MSMFFSTSCNIWSIISYFNDLIWSDSQPGTVFSHRVHWATSRDILGVTAGEKGAASSGYRPEMLLNILQYIE